MNRKHTTREAVLAAAEELARKEGPAAVTMRRVAASCGMALGTLYGYYSSKDELMTDVIEGFWKSAFHGRRPGYLRMDGGGNTDFREEFRQFYLRAADALRQFEKIFLSQMTLVRAETRWSGKRREGEYLDHIRDCFVKVLKADGAVRPGVWSESFTPERFAALLLEAALEELRDGNYSPEFLQELIERTLYECTPRCGEKGE